MYKFNLENLRSRFKEHADSERAYQMKRYMKELFPFFGIQAGPRRAVCRQFINDNKLPDKNDLFDVIKLLWEQDEREFHHFGAELAFRYKKFAVEEDLEIYKWMITHKSWWDTVDFIASNHVGNYFKKYNQQASGVMKDWLVSENMWLQRTTLLFQLKYKEDTNTRLLTRQIMALKDSKEFFIRKAIGWALREYSKTAPAWVEEFVDNTTMSGLSSREALKVIRRKKAGA